MTLVNAWIQEAADLAGIPGTFRAELSERGPQLVVLSGDSDRQPAELAASPGTIRFLTLMPEVRHALRTGGTLFADHIDSLHSDLFAQILPLFRNAETNPRHAQLVFASQNPAILDEDILRRDEIMLVSRNRDTGESTLYPLSDFSVAPAGILFSADGERREEQKGKETEIL